MQRYLARRLLLVIVTLIGVSMVVFMAVRFLPGDVVVQLAAELGASPEFRAAIEKKYSLGENLPQQYFEWAGDVLSGDLGTSIISTRPVVDELKVRLPPTFQLGLMAMTIALIISLPVGILSAIRQDSFIDFVARSFAIGLLATPSFWIGLLAISYGFIWLGWTPPLRYHNLWEDPVANIKLMWVPALILGTHITGTVMRLTRSTMLEVLRQDYIRTAWSKGLRERVIVTRHALRNAIIPVITVIGMQVPLLLGGTVILEFIFSIPGMGSYFLLSIQLRDYPVVQIVVLISAVAVVMSNLVVDLAYSLFDPRVRYA